ncbi:MAG: FeoA family protein [Planctomycetota bacterium]
MPLIPLDLLQAGEHARIVDLDGEPTLVTRLREMGLREDAEVTMVQSGEPCIIAVDNHRLSLRSGDTTVIMVETL